MVISYHHSVYLALAGFYELGNVTRDLNLLPFELVKWLMGISPAIVVAQLCAPLCDPVECSTPGFPVLHCPLEFAQTHVH